LWTGASVAADARQLPTTRSNEMGELYDRMAQDLKLKNLAAETTEAYLRCCCDFVRYHMRSPRELGETAIKQYLAHLQLRGASPEKIKMHVAGVKFLYAVTLDRPKVAERIPWPKVPHKQPDILSGTEVAKLLEAVVPGTPTGPSSVEVSPENPPSTARVRLGACMD
jgi:site-specific recombinase XerD